jgi:hypothetical protein
MRPSVVGTYPSPTNSDLWPTTLQATHTTITPTFLELGQPSLLLLLLVPLVRFI